MTTNLPDEAWIVALLSLPKLGPARLHRLLETQPAREVWKRLCDGAAIDAELVGRDTIDTWRRDARAMSVAEHWEAIAGLGIAVHARGIGEYPRRLNADLEPPAVLFSLGDRFDVLAPNVPTVGIVGTRKCTSYGRRVAFELGAALARSGVSVVSGLALGIDAAAHDGVLSVKDSSAGRPVGVVGSGLDIIYPRRNARLWAAVPERGLLLSETPPGVGPESWRFPARNRIIAALSDAIIVVESHERGGSLITVDEAQLRDLPIGVVPGPITSNSAGGTNQLLRDGATPILDVSDVHALIGYVPPRSVDPEGNVATDSLVLDALGWTPLSFEQLCARIVMPVAAVAGELEQLIARGLCVRDGPWIERVR